MIRKRLRAAAGALGLGRIYRATVQPVVNRLFFTALIRKTSNFATTNWLGQPIWQNILDLWTIQETLCELRPALLVECGTNRGGSALFYAHLFDLLGEGRVITIDVEKMHDLVHPRVEFLLGSSVSEDIAARVREAADEVTGPVMVILDSDHTVAHVERELETYAGVVTPGSYLLVQDGVLDILPYFRESPPGPLVALRRFLERHPEFEVDRERCDRFLVTHHPSGWLRRKGDGVR